MRVVAFTGAGISRASGIPTFEELGDVRDKLSRSYFRAQPEEFYRLLKTLKEKSDHALPNPAHLALAEYKVPIVTMNVDGLHTRAGSKEVLEIHGHLRSVRCRGCQQDFPFDQVDQSIRCLRCHQILEPKVVLYEDQIPHYGQAIDMVCSADLLLVIGTSFYTSTSNMALMAKEAGIQTRIINEAAEVKVPEVLEALLH